MSDGRDFAPIDSGIDKGAEAHRSDHADFFACNGAPQLADHALREQVAFDFVLFDQVDHV